MKNLGFLLFRLNLVDREGLFGHPLREDADLVQVMESAASEEFDVKKKGRKSEYSWALRGVMAELTGGVERPFIFAVFSHQLTSWRGAVVTRDGFEQGTSILSPPTATPARIVVDLKRHILGIEEVSGLISPNGAWKKSLETILGSAAWKLNFTSMIRLDPIVPDEVVESQITSFDRITRLRLTLRIPNPDLGPSYERLYAEMLNGGVRELTQDMRNEQGLTLGSQTLPQASLDMAMNGYKTGKVRISGFKDGRKEDYTVAEDVARVEIEDLGNFIEGYAAASQSTAVKRFAQLLIRKIDAAANR